MTLDANGLLVAHGDGTAYWVAGDLYTIKANGEDTGEAYALCEVVVQPQGGTPPHTHSRESESFYVLEGEAEFHLDDQTVIAGPGTFLHSPRGQLHWFTNVTTVPTKLLIWVTPAGFEKFIAAVGEPAIVSAAPPQVSPADLEKILAAAPQYGIEIVPPPTATVG